MRTGSSDHKCEQEEVERINALNALMYGPAFYFRGSYNCFSMLNAFGLSWWTDIAKVTSKNRAVKSVIEGSIE
jgi:hypothetical protein